MRVVSVEEMRELESTLFEHLGMTESLIIENVGIRAFDFLFQRYLKHEVFFIIGKGNNGADGLAMARHCFNAGMTVKVFLCYSDEECSPELFKQIELARAFSIPLIEGTDESVLRTYLGRRHMDDAIIVDAILGIGYHPPLDHQLSRVISYINSLKLPVISIDIPSGVVASTGLVDETAINATVTLSIELPKIGHLVFEGKKYTGELVQLSVGFPKSIIGENEGLISLLSYNDLKFLRSESQEHFHKNDFGHLLVIAGSLATSGAAVMCAHAALKVGVGLVTVKSWKDAVPLIACRLAPEVMLGEISSFNDIERFDSLLLGPGLGTGDDAKKLVRYLLEIFSGHLILDADALNILAQENALSLLKTAKAKSITITPHIAEFSRLLKIDTDLLQEAILEYVQEFAKEYRINIILKDSTSFIADSDGFVRIAHFPNRVLATAGSGDILAGTVAGLVAKSSRQRFTNVNKNCIQAVLLHSMAGDMSRKLLGEEGVIATDILQHYSEIMRTHSVGELL